VIEQFAGPVLTTPDAERLGVAPGPLHLRRVWPRSADRVLLEYVDGGMRVVAGQWHRDPRKARRTARETGAKDPDGTAVVVVTAGGLDVLLHGRGADRRLPGLAAVLRMPHATLVSHRPERRAVVRLGGDVDRFAKIVRPTAVADTVAAMERVAALPDRPFDVPAVLDVDETNGVIVQSALLGVSLHERLARADEVDGVDRLGAALRRMHDGPPAPGPGHDAAAEIEVLEKWLDRVGTFASGTAAAARGHAEPVFARLRENAAPAALLHRDLHDKQVFLPPGGRVGLLDVDTLTMGEAALDVANLLAHLELRALQGHCAERASVEVAAAFVRGYEPSDAVRARLPAYLDASRLRLACVYAHRPAADLVPRLLERLGVGHGVAAVVA
jgi:aminoglycoside phosphotransferase